MATRRVPPAFGAALADADGDAVELEPPQAASSDPMVRHGETDDRTAHQQLAPRHPPLLHLLDQVLSELALEFVLVHAALPLVENDVRLCGERVVQIRHYRLGFQLQRDNGSWASTIAPATAPGGQPGPDR